MLDLLHDAESLLYSDKLFEAPVLGIVNDYQLSDQMFNDILDLSLFNNSIESTSSTQSSDDNFILDLPWEVPQSTMSHNSQHLMSTQSLLSQNLKGRPRKHFAQKIFKCTQCDSTFTRRYDLKRHSYKHTGYPYICRCGKGYDRHDLFMRHSKSCIQ